MTADERPVRFRDARPRVQPRVVCVRCKEQGKHREQKTEAARVDHLTNYHKLCIGCAFLHQQHAGPCAECQCGHEEV